MHKEKTRTPVSFSRTPEGILRPSAAILYDPEHPNEVYCMFRVLCSNKKKKKTLFLMYNIWFLFLKSHAEALSWEGSKLHTALHFEHITDFLALQDILQWVQRDNWVDNEYFIIIYYYNHCLSTLHVISSSFNLLGQKP